MNNTNKLATAALLGLMTTGLLSAQPAMATEHEKGACKSKSGCKGTSGVMSDMKEKATCQGKAGDMKEKASCHGKAGDMKEKASCQGKAGDMKEKATCQGKVEAGK
jgi:hypothetical protein